MLFLDDDEAVSVQDCLVRHQKILAVLAGNVCIVHLLTSLVNPLFQSFQACCCQASSIADHARKPNLWSSICDLWELLRMHVSAQ